MKWLVLVLLWAGVALLGGWLRWIALIPALVASYFILGLWWYRNSTPWRRVYFRAIGVFAPLAGVYLAAAEAAGTTYDPATAFPALLRRLYPSWSERQVSAALQAYEQKLASGAYRAEWEKHFHEVFAQLPATKRQELMLKHFTEADRSIRARSLIADLIEREAGSAQRAAFWRALFAGQIQ